MQTTAHFYVVPEPQCYATEFCSYPLPAIYPSRRTESGGRRQRSMSRSPSSVTLPQHDPVRYPTRRAPQAEKHSLEAGG